MQATAAAERTQDDPRWLYPATFLGILLIMAVVFGSLPAPAGPLLGVPGNLDGAQVRAGVPFTYASIPLQNLGPGPVALLGATMGPHTPGLHLLGTGVAKTWSGYTIDPRGYPLMQAPGVRPDSPAALSPVDRTILPAGPLRNPTTNFAWLVVGLRVDHPGNYALRGMLVTYRSGRFTYTERIGPILSVCVPLPGARTCHAPSNVAW